LRPWASSTRRRTCRSWRTATSERHAAALRGHLPQVIVPPRWMPRHRVDAFPKSRSRPWHPPNTPSRPGHSSRQSWRRWRANVIAVANNWASPPQDCPENCRFLKNFRGRAAQPTMRVRHHRAPRLARGRPQPNGKERLGPPVKGASPGKCGERTLRWYTSCRTTNPTGPLRWKTSHQITSGEASRWWPVEKLGAPAAASSATSLRHSKSSRVGTTSLKLN